MGTTKETTMKVFLLTAEHFSTPGVVMDVYAKFDRAEDEAIKLVNIMLDDSDKPQDADTSNWMAKVEALQDEHGAAHCYVEIYEKDLID